MKVTARALVIRRLKSVTSSSAIGGGGGGAAGGEVAWLLRWVNRRRVDSASVDSGGDSAGGASSLLRDVARFVDEGGGLNVPTDLGLVPSEALRELRGSLE